MTAVEIEQPNQIFVRIGNDVCGDKRADLLGRSPAGLNRGLNGADIPAQADRDHAPIYFFYSAAALTAASAASTTPTKPTISMSPSAKFIFSNEQK